jgi:hypothetical protein
MSEVNQQRTMGTTMAPSAASMTSSSTDGAEVDKPEDETGEYGARRSRLQGKDGAV